MPDIALENLAVYQPVSYTHLYKNMTAWCLTLQSYCTSVFKSFGRMASDIIPVMRTTLRQCLERHTLESLCRHASVSYTHLDVYKRQPYTTHC